MDKKYIYILVVVIIVMLTFLLYPIDQEQSKPILEETIKVETLKEEEPIEITYETQMQIVEKNDKEPVERDTVKEMSLPKDNGFVPNIYTSDVMDIYNLEVEEKTVTLFNAIDNKNKYSISLKSSQKITSILPEAKYIQINGTLEDDDKKSQFTLSFNEYYKDYTQYSYLEVTNKETNITATCDGSFLGAIEPQYRYFITLKLYDEVLSCYMNSEEDINEKGYQVPKDFNISNKTLPPMKERTVDDFFKTNQTKGKTNGNIN